MSYSDIQSIVHRVWHGRKKLDSPLKGRKNVNLRGQEPCHRRKLKSGVPSCLKGEAKGRIVPVRFTADVLKPMIAKAKASNQTVSEWIRNSLNAAL